MDTLPGKPVSLWLDTTPQTDYPSQTEDFVADVAVLGGGIVGVISAFLLSRAGRKVCLVERRRVASAVSGHTTAKLTSLHGAIYRRLLSLHGADKTRLYAQANQAGLEWVAQTVDELFIDCDFARAPAYTYGTQRQTARDLEAEASTAADLGLPASFTRETELPFAVAGAVRFEAQARFHPRKFLLSLAEGLADAGGHVFEQTQAQEVRGRGPYTVVTSGGRIRADQVIVATHLPFLNRGLFFARTSPRRHPVIALHSSLAPLEGMYLAYDDSHPHSLRTQPWRDGHLLIVGGSSWKTAHVSPTSERWQNLVMQARHHLAVDSVEYRWGAQDHYSADLLPFVGKLHPMSEGLYAATGFGAWGMTNGAAAGLLLTDMVLGRSNDWSEVFDPGRLNVRASARKLVTENLDNAGRILLPRLRPPRGILASVHEGQGRVIEHAGRRMAVSRDEAGDLHALSPSCGHLGCIVGWNDAEQTWDCPCHGSRYTPRGEVLEGPTLKGLEPLDLA